MKNNRSLAVSTIINEELHKESLLSFFGNFIQDNLSDKEKGSKSRDRVFTQKTTLEAMLLSSTLDDKSLKNAVTMFYFLHQRNRKTMEQGLMRQVKDQKEKDKNKPVMRGRPKNYDVKLPKSKADDISLNTAGYSKARKRLPIHLTVSLFESSKIKGAKNNYSHWHNLKVFEVDGTYLQLQDTQEIRKKYPVKNKKSGEYPQPY